MYGLEWLIGTGIAALVVGAGMGYLISSKAVPSARRADELSEKLESAQEEMRDYRQSVYDQFEETARRFKDLNNAYDALHRQLAGSAQQLIGDTAPPLLAHTASDQNDGEVDDLVVVGEHSDDSEANEARSKTA